MFQVRDDRANLVVDEPRYQLDDLAFLVAEPGSRVGSGACHTAPVVHGGRAWNTGAVFHGGRSR